LPPSANRRLAGRGILVTRPREQAAPLLRRVEAEGARALAFPAMEIDPPSDPAPAAQLARELESFDLAIFVSPTAVQKGLALVGGAWPRAVRAAGVGSGTRAELERQGIEGAWAPQGAADSEALLALPELAEVRGKRIAIFRGEGGRELLAETLSRRGARVEHAVCYRRSPPRGDIAPVLEAWRAGALHAVTSSSSAGLGNLLRSLGKEGAHLMRATPLFVSHERIADEARRLGARTIVVAGPGDAEMVDALVAYFQAP
jgi:uroporphyrinogen-III synthase